MELLLRSSFPHGNIDLMLLAIKPFYSVVPYSLRWKTIYNFISHSTIKLASPNGTKATQLLILSCAATNTRSSKR